MRVIARYFLAASMAILAGTTAHAQQDSAGGPAAATATDATAPDTWFTRVAFSPSRVIAASDFQSGGDAARSVSVEIGRQTNGSSDWHRVYNYPSYGVGLYAARFDHEQELGKPLAAYGFFSWPFPIARRVQLSADVGLGVTWNWNPFDARTNPTNTALGSSLAYHVQGAALVGYLATAHASVFAGVNVTHWSNGATKQPNLGLAVIGPEIGVRYDVDARTAHARPRDADLPAFVPAWEFVVGGAGSSKNVVAAGTGATLNGDRRRSFAAFNVTAAVQRQFYRFGKVASGADVTYDGAAGARVDVVNGREIDSRAPADQRFATGVYGGYEHVMARLSVLLHLGYTLSRGVEDENVPRFYQRYGARFQFSDHLWGTFAVRSVKGRKADFMELGLGYRVRLAGRGARQP
jgi:hypothetical protein